MKELNKRLYVGKTKDNPLDWKPVTILKICIARSAVTGFFCIQGACRGSSASGFSSGPKTTKFYAVNPSPLDWNAAKSNCETIGDGLATFHSYDEREDFMFSMGKISLS